MNRPLRIAMLSHSTNPRGGVVHAMQLAEALASLGHEVTLHAPDVKRSGFFRTPSCTAIGIPASPAPADMTAMVRQRIAEYVGYFESRAHRNFDIFHAHDGISGNALATLKARGLIPGFARTVHHIDSFEDPRLMELQDRSIVEADAFFTVSGLWQHCLLEQRGLPSTIVGNGVDVDRFSSASPESAASLRRRMNIPEGPIFLAIGGIEERKNTLRMLQAFSRLRLTHPLARLVVAGGASLLDHRGYQGEFRASLAALGETADAVHILGTIADADMPALYRMADALVFASIKEGFGLVVLEAMASGIPVIVSSIAPFDEFLASGDALWCDPYDPASIAGAMAMALSPIIRRRVVAAGILVASHHSWTRTACRHLEVYDKLREIAHA